MEVLLRAIITIIAYIISLIVFFSFCKKKEEKWKRPVKKVMGKLVDWNNINVTSAEMDESHMEPHTDAKYSFTIDGVKYTKKFKIPYASIVPNDEAMICYVAGKKDAYLEKYPPRHNLGTLKVLFVIFLAPMISSLITGIIFILFGIY